MVKFQFISSGDSASYRIEDYGGPHHDKRFELRSVTPTLYWPDSKKRYNYTEEEFQNQVIAAVGYLRWEFDNGEMFPMEYAVQFEKEMRASWDAAMIKYPGWTDEEYQSVKGVARWGWNERWITAPLELPSDEGKENDCD